MNERIEKKLAQIEKIQKKVIRLEKDCSAEEIKIANQFKTDYPGWVRYHKEKNLSWFGSGYELRRALSELETAKAQLEKIQKQEEVKKAKEDSLNDMPEALKKFAEKMEMIWNEYDKNEREFLKRRYKEYKDTYPELGKAYHEFLKAYKYSGYAKMSVTDEEIEKENKKAVDALILNLFNRVIEKTGKITDAAGLRVTTGNSGYAVINGVVIGEKGRAVVESIGAGGYNIQRYHIRTLVK